MTYGRPPYNSGRPPVWFIILMVIVTIPAFAALRLLAEIPDHNATLQWMIRLFPLYVVVADALAWICWWPRRMMSWVLMALLALSEIAIFAMPAEFT